VAGTTFVFIHYGALDCAIGAISDMQERHHIFIADLLRTSFLLPLHGKTVIELLTIFKGEFCSRPLTRLFLCRFFIRSAFNDWISSNFINIIRKQVPSEPTDDAFALRPHALLLD
jgi:hypothetical protein